MIITDDDARKYPDLRAYLLYSLSQLPQSKPAVYKALRKYTAFEPAIAIMWGTTPWLSPEDSQMTQCVDVGEEKIGDNLYVMRRTIPWYGFTVPNRSSDKILIAADLASLGGTKDEIVLEATILHEVVHWTWLKAGRDDYDKEDAPRAFEREAYGKVVLRTWKSCFEQEYYKVK